MIPPLTKLRDWSAIQTVALTCSEPRFVRSLVALVLAVLLFHALPGYPAGAEVVLQGDATTFALANGLITARVAKASGDLLSMEFHGKEMLSTSGRRSGGYWSHNVALAHPQARVTIDPMNNGGERAEVSLKAIYQGKPLGSGPGGSAVANIEIRYALARGDSGLYTYCIFEHRTNYPAFSLGEARFCAKLNDELFDWMTVDAKRNLKMLTAADWNHGTVMNMKEVRRLNSGIYQGRVEHKYDYSANQFDVRAWGWSSTQAAIGLWLINPSVEYLSGGPTKFELCAHRDATFGTNVDAPAPPTVLNYWRSSHYGGSSCVVRQGEGWTKCIGPFLIYCNSGPTPQALWQEALAKARSESDLWPYGWVTGVDYPDRTQRATVRGRLRLIDPAAPGSTLRNLQVGLTAPDYLLPSLRSNSMPQLVEWQQDAKFYQFWVRGDDTGGFVIPKVRPGCYTLRAIADCVLGEFTLTNVVVTHGAALDLGEIAWRPLHYGQQLWDIGVPNRSGAEFFKGDDYFHWGWYLEYSKLFPSDVRYAIGQSDFRKDWFFEEVPHNEDPANLTGRGTGRATTWTITFLSPPGTHGRATLRLAICGVGTRRLDVTLNGNPIGAISDLVPNATINRDGIAGTWSEHDLAFDATLLRSGTNTLRLTVPAGPLTSGIIYDYLRLELDNPGIPTQ